MERRPKIHFRKGSNELLSSFTSTNGAIRQFCRVCGSSLTFRGGSQETTIEFSLATLNLQQQDQQKIDSQFSFEPDAHVFCRSRVPWIPSIAGRDSLPKYMTTRDSQPLVEKDPIS